MKRFLALALIGALSGTAFAQTFLAKPYLQLGREADTRSLALLWHTEDAAAEWSVEYRPKGEKAWRKAPAPTSTRVAVPTVEPHRVWNAPLSGLTPGAPFEYRVLKGGAVAFQAEGVARKGPGQPQRVLVMGDVGLGSRGQKAVAYQAFLQKPDLAVIAGDIVYGRGSIPEYRTNYFPIYNADAPDPGKGAPLLRGIPFVGVLGNHDVEQDVRAKHPDTLACFLYFDQPLNGPALSVNGPNTPTLYPLMAWGGFLEAAGPRFPAMGNFSFDTGDVHWTVLDSDPYVHWDDPALKAWLEKDLAGSKKAIWHLVVFHHAPFSSSFGHFNDQWMRFLCPVLQKYGVDMTLTGHVHNYQRTLPLTFEPAPDARSGLDARGRGPVKGVLHLDSTFDGARVTKAHGIIHIVTGAGGGELYDTAQGGQRDTWQPFTRTFVSDRHSCSMLDIQGRRLEFRQIDQEGHVIDRFVLTK